MKFFTKALLDGFGSVLDLYPRRTVRLRDLRETYYADLRKAEVLQRVDLRNSSAASIRGSLAEIAKRSAELSNRVQALTTRRPNDAGGKDPYAEINSKLHVQIHKRPAESGSTPRFLLYSDSVQGLADMLALRDDCQKISQDLNRARDCATHHQGVAEGPASP